MKNGRKVNVALAHHWLHAMRGGEKVLEQFCLMFPDAPIYTLFHRKKSLLGVIRDRQTFQSWLGYLPKIDRYYRNLLPAFPAALSTLRVASRHQFLLSCDASVVKGLETEGETQHCCYCCSPPRYLFDLQEQYLEDRTLIGATKSYAIKAFTPYLREFDIRSARRVDSFITLSKFVEERIDRIYGRSAAIVEPPVDVANFSFGLPTGDFYLIVSALVPYKKVDLAILACNYLKRKLVVIGDGPDFGRLRSLAGPTVKLLGAQPFSVLKRAYEECRAFIFPGIEDFGITALEAQAAGKPVIAIRKGAVTETVIERQTGIFFDDQTVDSLIAGFFAFERDEHEFNPINSRRNAEGYRPEEFRRKMKNFLVCQYPDFFADYNWPI
jgi:glycosyltransferase involved in cell wall biosynthesis